jgi:tetratricopeptide (TPR) repeat protein
MKLSSPFELAKESSMRMWIVMLVLAVTVTAVAQSTPAQPPSAGAQQPGAQPPAAQQPAAGAQQPATQQPTTGSPTGQPAAPQQKKEIKDPAEYNSYLNAIQQTSDQGKAVALEGFLQQYPNSVVKVDAFELLMATYQKLNNLQKVIDTGNRLLHADPNNLRALALMTYLKRQDAERGTAGALAEAQQFAQRGLQALPTAARPEGMSDADFLKFKSETSAIFNGVLGLAALQNKDYPVAQQHLQQSVTANPNNLSDIYPLALAYLQAPQPNYLQGIWYIARAANLASGNPAAAQQISKYGRSAYIKYHGNEQGWDQVMMAAGTNPTPPAGFTIQPRPTPAEEAATLVQSKQVKDMSFDEFQLVFTSGNQQAADTVWNQIKDKPIAFAAKVVEATPTKLTLSATADDIEKNVPDVTLTMVAAIPARLVPKAGTMTQVEGTPSSFTAQPFMITMGKGSLIGQEKPAAATPAKKPPARRPH